MTDLTYIIICVVVLVASFVALEIQARQIKKLKKEIKKYQSEDPWLVKILFDNSINYRTFVCPD